MGYFTTLGKVFLGAVIVAAILIFLVIRGVFAAPAPKYFVCKYVGTPGVDEVLQTGQNPISVSGNALTPPIEIGAYFNDKQGRSYVMAEDTGQAEPECPVPVNDPEPPVDDPEEPKEDEPKEEVPEVTDEERTEKVVESKQLSNQKGK